MTNDDEVCIPSLSSILLELYPLNQPAVASVRRRCCVCLHKIRRMVVGVLTFAHGANFCFGLFARACILYVYSTLCSQKV